MASDRFAELSPPYATVVADPPWRYRTKAGLGSTAKHARTQPAADARYGTMDLDEIRALPVGDLAAPDAHLYLWTTCPHLPDAFSVVEAWGFRYVTTITWVKTGTLGLGYYFRGDTEHVLFAVRGRLPIPAERRQRNVITAPKTGHSRKPPAFGDLVEQASPGSYVELFAREPRLGWDSWGHGYELAVSTGEDPT